MKEIIINEDQKGQRIDRYLRKLLGNASLSFLYKQLRKKNIVVNDKKVNEKYILKENDLIKIYFSDETIEKFKTKEKIPKSNVKINVVYEDENIIVMNKEAGLLSHAAKKNYREDNLVDGMTSYLIKKGDYQPKRSSTFSPALANRLDRNTSGLIIGAKTYAALQELNRVQRENSLDKFYKTIVVGKVDGEKIEKAYFEKLADKDNQVRISKNKTENSKEVVTGYKSLKTGERYSLLEIDLITGRTHQIRAHLAYLKMPLVGDRKYGLARINKYFKDKYGLKNQLLHCYKLVFNGFEGDFSYLNGKIIEIENTEILNRIIKGEIDEEN
ncbi:RluA family pseudouridine synthase [Neofamilia massiliensis]|uniref:RluA family pseudouridine synthase n=1 Tax=Neofamilia massiliensis TaxID=1673724 RepID=UPI0006BB69AF|nr:RluA family pseudouridine synthase [Neofamilia massiliensis]